MKYERPDEGRSYMSLAVNYPDAKSMREDVRRKEAEVWRTEAIPMVEVKRGLYPSRTLTN